MENGSKKAFGQQVEPLTGRLVLFETTPFCLPRSACFGRVFPLGEPEFRLPPITTPIILAPTDRRDDTFFHSPKRPQDPWYFNFRPPRDSLFNIWYLMRNYFRNRHQ